MFSTFNIIKILTTADRSVCMSNAEEWMLIEAKPNSTSIPQH